MVKHYIPAHCKDCTYVTDKCRTEIWPKYSIIERSIEEGVYLEKDLDLCLNGCSILEEQNNKATDDESNIEFLDELFSEHSLLDRIEDRELN